MPKGVDNALKHHYIILKRGSSLQAAEIPMKGYDIKYVLLFLALLLLPSSALRAEKIIVYGIKTEEDVVYAKTPSGKLRLDVSWPVDGGPYPIIVYFHGGGWALGDKALIAHRARLLAKSGYVVFNANYRLVPEALFPAAINDAMAAVIFAKENAKNYNGDPQRTAVMGDSAGGHLAAMVAFAWDDPYFEPTRKSEKYTAQVRAAVLLYGGYRLKWIYDENPKLWNAVSTRPLVLAFMGGTPKQKPKEYLKGSPASYLNKKNLPPVFILCGTSDSAYPESLWLHNALQERRVEHTALFVTGADHEFNYLETREDFPYLYQILAFLDRRLGNKP